MIDEKPWRGIQAARAVVRRLLSRVPYPGLNDVIEVAGVLLIAAGLFHWNAGLAMVVSGAYLRAAGNLRGRND